MTLRRQLFIGISLVFLFVLFGLLYAGISGTRAYLEDQLATHAQETASSLVMPLSQSLGRGDTVLATTQVSTLFDRGYYQRIAVVGTDGSEIVGKELPAKIDKVPLWFSSWLTLQAPAGEAFITSGWKQLGKVLVISQPTYAYQYLWTTCLETAGWMLAAYVVALFLTRLLLHLILNPLRQIERSALDIQQRQFRQISLKPRALELARVVRAMNDMSRKIAEMLALEAAKAETYRKEAYQDGLTGLDNRRSFDLRFDQLLAGEIQFSEGALIGIEINNLKAFNTEASYKKGDDFLVRIAAVGREVLGAKAAILCRIGGTSFGFAVAGLGARDMDMLARELHGRLRGEFGETVGEADISFSIGIVHFRNGDQRSRVMSRLDLAIESARQSGRNALQHVQDTGGDAGAIGSLAWRELIRNALAEGRWTLVGQPVINLASGALIHLEIMARLVDQEGKLVPASLFMPMALRHQLMAEVDRALLELAFKVLERRRPGSAGALALNMSSQSLGSGDFMNWLSRRLGRLARDGMPLSFELSEYGCSQDMEMARRFAAMVRNHNARFGIDHFGLAPDSLAMLRELPPDYIKLDSRLVKEAQSSESSHALLLSIVSLARSLEIEIIAQGVETAEEAAMLSRDQIGGGQGYHFGAPSADAVL